MAIFKSKKEKEDKDSKVKSIKSRKKNKKDEDFLDEVEEITPKATFLNSISYEVKKSIFAIFLLGTSLILILSAFHKAGPFGELIYSNLFDFLGVGYFLTPSVMIVIGLFILTSKEVKLISPSIVGGSLFTLSTLMMVDIYFPNKSGLLGQTLGTIENSFGSLGSLVLGSVVLVSSTLLTFNTPLNISKLKIKNKNSESDVDSEDDSINSESDIMENLEGDPSDTNDSKIALTGLSSEDKDKNKEDFKKEVIKKESSSVNTNSIPTSPQSKDNLNINSVTLSSNYNPPPLSLLKTAIEKPQSGDLRGNANIIKRTLESFGIAVEMGEINIGPKVTRYTLKPAEGVKVAKINSLSQDLSLALAAHPIRIEAPIPGKSLVGIEVPNKTSATVRLGSLLSYELFTKSAPLNILLGRDVNGEPVEANIAKMPHLLVSGATGSGKSILVHGLIVSLLYKNGPDTLRFIMIDPKRVELSIYNGIPHLASPVVVEGKKSISVFRWAVSEMEKRYETLQRVGARDIGSYNEKMKDEKMPFIVIVVDELADLMTAFGKEIEVAIVRLAQMARAVGIHLILATQRPSVEVITGLIKANVPSRIALQVASQIDSRTILDASGAEKLLGGGDMLFISPQHNKPHRVQGAYISEEEIHKVAEYIRENNQVEIAEDLVINKEVDNKEGQEGGGEFKSNVRMDDVNFDDYAGGDEDEDDMLQEALKAIYESKKASASFLQRRLKVGYARAARLLDIMEEKGAIGKGEGAKPREIFEDSPIFLKYDIQSMSPLGDDSEKDDDF